MQWCLYCATVSLLTQTLDSNISVVNDVHSKSKRAVTNNFDILLSMYKMNPLKKSNVFKTFSNSILLLRPDGRTPDLNFDSNESTKEKRIRTQAKFKQIEDAIHVTQVGKSIVKRPSLNIQDTVEGDIKIPRENDDILFQQGNPYRQDYSKLSLVHDTNNDKVKSVQNMQKADDLQANESYKNTELPFFSIGDRITKDSKGKDEAAVFVMR